MSKAWLLWGLPLVLAVPAAPGGTRLREGEPPLRLVLELDRASFALVDGVPAEVVVDGRRLRAAVHVAATRTFAAAGVQFEFPRAMSWRHEALEGVEVWSLDGGSCTVLFQQFEAGEPADLAREVLVEALRGVDEGFGRPRATAMSLGGRQLPALRGRVTLADVAQEWLAVGVLAGGRPTVLLLQDVLDEGGDHSAELQALQQLLDQSFRVAP